MKTPTSVLSASIHTLTSLYHNKAVRISHPTINTLIIGRGQNVDPVTNLLNSRNNLPIEGNKTKFQVENS